MGLPEALAKFRTNQSVESKPIQAPAPPPVAEWQATNRRDGTTYYEGTEAEMYYADGVTPAMEQGFHIEAALEDARLKRKAAQIEATKQQAPQQLPFRPSPVMSEAFERLMDGRREQKR